jgi:hypothetical protein
MRTRTIRVDLEVRKVIELRQDELQLDSKKKVTVNAALKDLLHAPERYES